MASTTRGGRDPAVGGADGQGCAGDRAGGLQALDAGVLVDAHARPVGRPPAGPRPVGPGAPAHRSRDPTARRGGSASGSRPAARRGRGRPGRRRARGPWPRPRAARRTWCGSVATSSSPVRSKSQSIPSDATVASMASRFSAPSRSSAPTSSGNRSIPLASPCVRLAAQNPPLRPDAAHPQRSASSTSTSRDGSSALASRAAHRPVYPPPTTTRSARAVPTRGGAGSGAAGSSSQNDRGRASAKAAARSMGPTYRRARTRPVDPASDGCDVPYCIFMRECA